MIKYLGTYAAVLMVLLLSARPLSAQQGRTISLFEARSEVRAATDLPDHQQSRTYFSLNASLHREGSVSEGDRLQVPVGGSVNEFDVERITQYTPGTYSVIARGDDGEGELMSYTVKEGRMMGDIHLHSQGELYQMAYDPVHGSNYLASVDPGNLDVVGCPTAKLPEGLDSSTLELQHNRQGDPSAPPDSHSIIDVLIVYTLDAEQWMEGYSSTDLYIAEAMNRSQMAMDVSQVNIQLNLAHSARINYPENSTSSSTTLERLTNPTDGYMDKVHTLRDNHNADLVAMFADINDVGGIAWLLFNHSGRKDLAFSVNRVRQLHSAYTLAHEMGHNMGNHHSRNQSTSPAPSGGGLNDYSTGWRWFGNDGSGYVSVMTYNEGDAETPYFSNPDISYQGAPTGSYSGQYAPADNARSMNEIRAVIADYEERIAPPEPVTLLTPTTNDIQIPVNPTLTWEESDRADSYEVEIATTEAFQTGTVEISREVGTNTLTTMQTLDNASVYYWRVRASNSGGSSDWSEVRSFTTVVDETKLVMNYPNPFSGNTTIEYQLAEETDVLLEIYNPLGRKVATVVDDTQQPRIYRYNFDASRYASGVYLVRMVAGGVSHILKMTHVK